VRSRNGLLRLSVPGVGGGCGCQPKGQEY
jgi:hypothetical protein